MDAEPPSPAGPRLSARWIRVLVTLAVAVVATVALRAVEPVRVVGDGHYYVVQALSLWGDGDLRLADEYAAYGDPYRSGSIDFVRPIGTAIVWAPATIATIATTAPDSPERLARARNACAFTSVFLAVLALIGLGHAARQAGASTAFAVALPVAVAAGTPWLPVSTRMALYPHAITAALAVATLLTLRPRARRWELPAVMALTVLVRPEFCALAALELTSARPWRERILRGALAGAAALLAVGAQAVVLVRAGLPPLPPSGTLSWDGFWFADALFGPRHGLLGQQSLMWALLLAACVVLVRRGTAPAARARVGAALSLGLALVWLESRIWDGWGGASYGARRCLPVIALVAWAGAALAPRGRIGHAALVTTVLLLGAAGIGVFSEARMVAGERGEPPELSAPRRIEALATSWPLLAARAAAHDTTWDAAWRLSWRHALFAWPALDPQPVQVLDRDSAAWREMCGTSETRGDTTYTRCVLPLHRMPLARILVEADAGARITAGSIDMTLEAELDAPGRYGAAVTPPVARRWVTLEVLTRGPAPERIVLFSDGRCGAPCEAASGATP